MAEARRHAFADVKLKKVNRSFGSQFSAKIWNRSSLKLKKSYSVEAPAANGSETGGNKTDQNNSNTDVINLDPVNKTDAKETNEVSAKTTDLGAGKSNGVAKAGERKVNIKDSGNAVGGLTKQETGLVENANETKGGSTKSALVDEIQIESRDEKCNTIADKELERPSKAQEPMKDKDNGSVTTEKSYRQKSEDNLKDMRKDSFPTNASTQELFITEDRDSIKNLKSINGKTENTDNKTSDKNKVNYSKRKNVKKEDLGSQKKSGIIPRRENTKKRDNESETCKPDMDLTTKDSKGSLNSKKHLSENDMHGSVNLSAHGSVLDILRDTSCTSIEESSEDMLNIPTPGVRLYISETDSENESTMEAVSLSFDKRCESKIDSDKGSCENIELKIDESSDDVKGVLRTAEKENEVESSLTDNGSRSEISSEVTGVESENLDVDASDSNNVEFDINSDDDDVNVEVVIELDKSSAEDEEVKTIMESCEELDRGYLRAVSVGTGLADRSQSQIETGYSRRAKGDRNYEEIERKRSRSIDNSALTHFDFARYGISVGQRMPHGNWS